MGRKGLLLLAAACLAFTAAVAAEEAPGEPKRPHHRMPAFADVDTDGDGNIVAEEFYAMQARHMAERARQGGKLENASRRHTFEDLDTDGDGKVSPEEFDAHHAQMRQKHRHRRQQPEA